MQLVILQVPDCRGADLLAERLAPLLAEHREVELARQIVTTAADAGRFGMTGSPTLLADGTDPFPGPGEASVSCRLYRDERGHADQAPSPALLRAALRW
jgi:hypothetical protein